MYSWLVVLHLVGLAVFLVAHGVSMWVAFRIRGEPNRDLVAALLGMSARGSQAMYLGLVLLGIGGLGAAASAGWLTAGWVQPSSRAAALIDPARATARKISSRRGSTKHTLWLVEGSQGFLRGRVTATMDACRPSASSAA